jgi:uncharacterized protein (DUF736 family)
MKKTSRSQKNYIKVKLSDPILADARKAISGEVKF